MAASGDVTFTQDGAKMHPYVVALVRWCVSYVWSAATVLLHRLMTSHPPPIAAAKSWSPRAPPRPASSGHLHPEPLVRCRVLHRPAVHHQDFIFVHGLYGSLENTWRQGDWRSKYKLEPNRIPLKRSASIPNPCHCRDCADENETKKTNYETSWQDLTYTKREFFNDRIEKVIADDELLMTEQFYSNTLLDQVKIVDNFEMQAQFVRELFECENMSEMYNKTGEKEKSSEATSKDSVYRCECNECQDENVKQCQVGCGCVCDKCYSPCWPKDWLKVDFPNARVISIDYTSDPYLWRPLWVKESKRLRLHERAEQMTKQLLDLGVGQRPIVWVGHSKGGLFIKQIYCEAYEAFLQTDSGEKDTNVENNNTKTDNTNRMDQNQNGVEQNGVGQNGGRTPNVENNNKLEDHAEVSSEDLCSEREEASKYDFKERSSLWSQSAGFMFYSVPHRGSPLADIKTPITARSIELLEISKDNSLVLSLQERWLAATSPRAPLVRSLVETNRTLMAVLWLRIVSEESADAGIGALCGISVDHREICKPSSRSCILYKELMNLIHASLDKWRWESL